MFPEGGVGQGARNICLRNVFYISGGGVGNIGLRNVFNGFGGRYVPGQDARNISLHNVFQCFWRMVLARMPETLVCATFFNVSGGRARIIVLQHVFQSFCQ